MLSPKEKKTLIGNLPEDWRQKTAAHFNKSISYIEKVAYGSVENIEVFEYLVSIAEKNKLDLASRMDELKDRIANLAKPLSA